MAKLKKDDLDALTRQALDVAGTAMMGLILSGCPIRQKFEQVEQLLAQIDTVRTNLELPSLTPDRLLEEERQSRKCKARIGFDYDGQQ